MTTSIGQRKADHIELCATGDVGFQAKTTLLEHVELLHDALPELALDAIDTSVTVLGKTLRAPLLVAAMTGGTDRARDINRALAAIVEERGYGFGLGSQRPMLRDPADRTYDVRDVAPTALVLGNIGGAQARELTTDAVRDLAGRVAADAMCVHLNPAMEIVQPGGDRDFSGILDSVARLAAELSIPVVAKETGCGLSPRAAKKLARAGVRHVDVSGAGGTSWVAVEAERAEGEARRLGAALRDWGVPTAASVAYARTARPRFETIIATGGVARGLEVAKALALGADVAGVARPVLRALVADGPDGARRMLDAIEAELRAVMLLVGARDVRALRKAPRVIHGELRRWLALARR
jgi:isopentenyl-diphosphate delta-isomerase